MNLLSIVCKNLWQQKTRSLLTIMGVGISISAFVSLRGLTYNLEDALQSTYKTRGADLVVMEKSTLDIFSSTIDQSYITKLKQISPVTDASPVLFYFYALQPRKYFLITGWEPECYLFDGLSTTGRSLQNENDIMLGTIAANRLGKTIDDTINIRGVKFKVSGVFNSKNMLEDGTVIVPLQTLQRIKKTPGKITAINLRLDMDNLLKVNTVQRKNVIHNVQDKINSQYGDLEVKDVQNFISTPFSTIFSFTWAIAAIALIIAIMGIISTMTMTVLERANEIGILMAVGWSKLRIFRLVLLESALFGLLGGSAGIVLGYMIMHILVTFPQIQGFIIMRYNWMFIAQAVSLSLAVGILAGIYPAVKAVSINIIEVLRHE